MFMSNKIFFIKYYINTKYSKRYENVMHNFIFILINDQSIMAHMQSKGIPKALNRIAKAIKKRRKKTMYIKFDD